MSELSEHFLEFLSIAIAALAIFVAISLVDPAPPALRAQRWIRRLGSAGILLVGLATLVSTPWQLNPASGTRLVAALLLVGACVAAALVLDHRQRSKRFYAAGAMGFALPVACALGLLALTVSPDASPAALTALGIGALYLAVAAGTAFVVIGHFRRRRSGGPLPLALAAALLLAGGLLCLHLMLDRGQPTRPVVSELEAVLRLLLLGLFALLALGIARRRWRAEREGAGGLRRSSRADPISGLPLPEVVAESFVRVLRLAVASRSLCAVVVLQFSALDRILSTQGKAARDRLYATAAWRLRSARRDEELIGAMGEQRFLLVLRVADADDALARVRSLIAMFDAPLGDGEERVRLRPSVGISLWPTHADDFPRLLADALVALERCPPGGLQLFHTAQRVENEQQLQVEHSLIQALGAGEIGLVLQPIIDSLSGEVRMVELLARWNHPQLGSISPRQFILVAEGSGAIAEFDRWLLREALATSKWLDAAGCPQIRVALNCSPLNLVDPRFLDDVERCVLDSGVDPSRIEVEVTEAALAEGEQIVIDSLVRLRSLGLGLTIDDFGIGHSSLARLRDLPVDTLKIDQSFVRDMDHPKGEFLVSGIIGLAHGLGKAVIAEGVETRAQRSALAGMGCEYLQGFLLSRPLSWRALLDFLGVDGDRAPPGRPAALADFDDPPG